MTNTLDTLMIEGKVTVGDTEAAHQPAGSTNGSNSARSHALDGGPVGSADQGREDSSDTRIELMNKL